MTNFKQAGSIASPGQRKQNWLKKDCKKKQRWKKPNIVVSNFVAEQDFHI